MYYQDFYQSPLGEIRLLADENGLCGLYFVGQKYDLRGFEKEEIFLQETASIVAAKVWLQAYFAGQDLPEVTLSIHGTDFQKKVWACLRRIPAGRTLTYGQLAEELSCKSAQAIGGAVGKNPLSLIIPCHRVLGADGALTGYAGGVERKAWLLEHEKRS
ncbi:methylated-DNA--[protein]-cysteine S-methyltransferase [Streptococcus gallolyticus]|nr:methylated-DNA--[protein]-cysteine S-methyltransferase [Streptococcus gallolyticus]MBY5040557.1 methylated-DNA--[protein]-cysteine S-methyltransferase [Streptococcus gallolyticus]